MERLSYADVKDNAAIDKRITSHDISSDDRKMLGEELAFPAGPLSCKSKPATSHDRTNWGLTGEQVGKHDDTLIALNINQHYKQIVQSLERGGKIVLLRSGVSANSSWAKAI